MKFRPCIDIHNGCVKQIVGGSLTDNENQLVGSACPGYADGDDPNVVGWPICRMPILL